MTTRLIIDGNAVYEIDEDCVRCREQSRAAVSRRETDKKKAQKEIQKETQIEKQKEKQKEGPPQS